MVPLLAPLATATAALTAVLGLIWVAARLARGAGLARTRSGREILTIEDSLSLDPRRRLLLVRCQEGRVLLMTGGTNDVVVGWLPSGKSANE